ncbi:MAG: AAA-like domain-containing protein [Nitrospiraceae bacterium]|nr:AAA-like domain-containing protein [Nitrospiraceae bacterium]
MNKSTEPPSKFYSVGGALQPGTPSYIERAADEELYKAIVASDFCYVLTTRQVGKTSLKARTAKRLQEEGFKTVDLDMTMISGESADKWYYGVASYLSQELGIGDDLDAWWNQRSNLPALQRLSEFFHYLLSKTSGRLVIFADEIEWTIQFPFSDNFFAAIRACYNARATKPEYERLTFVLLGVASPSDLIKDRTRTPFNIGRRIDLTDFSHKEASPLAWGLNADRLQAQQVLDRILYWTSGHPYLTQTLCELAAKTQNGTAAHGTVDRLVYEHFLSPKVNRDINLEFVRNRILEDKQSGKLLKLYRAIYQNAKVLDDPLSPIHSSLKLSGLVVPRDGGALAVRNRIYERVFTDQWAKEAMPANWSRRVAVASLAALVLGFGVWYEVLQPRPYIETLQTAREDYQVAYQAYQNLHSIFGYGGKADRLLAEF